MAFHFTSIPAYQQQLLNGDTTCAEAVEHYLALIKKNSVLNAFIQVFDVEARLTSRNLDEELKSGKELRPLHGVIIALKDVLSYKGHPVTAASGMLEGYKAVYNATCVQKLLEAGAIIIGMTNCDEFAMGSTNENSVYGPVLNAIDHSRVPGGSSGGSAVAVQAGLCMASLGTDTGGSVRQPADFCGIVGMKPTYGRISRYGVIAYASSFDQVGVFANSVEDTALVYQTIAGHDPMDATSSKREVETFLPEDTGRKYRFAWLAPTLELPGLDNEIRMAIDGIFKKLAEQGHEVTAVPFDLLDFIVPAYYVLTTAEASSNLSRYDGVRYGHHSTATGLPLTEYYKENRSEGFGKEVKRRIMLGSFVLSAGYYDAYFDKAQQVRRLIFNQTEAIFKDFDALIMPVSPTTAFSLSEKIDDPVAMYLADIYTVFANLAGLPGMSVPMFKHSNGMPFGLQVLTNRWEELNLHTICHYLHSFR